MAVLANHSQTRATQYLTSSLQVSMANVLCWLVAILCLYDETMGQKTRESITHVARLMVSVDTATQHSHVIQRVG